MRNWLLLILVCGCVTACASAEPADEAPEVGGDVAGGDVRPADSGAADTADEDADSADTAADTVDADGADGADGASADAGSDSDVPDADDTSPDDSGPECGNGEIEDGEECDDGNTDDTDGCSSDCLLVGAGLCAPCELDEDCGLSGDLCLELGDGSRCARACDDTAPCDEGYSCQAVDDGDDARQCVPDDGYCEGCPDADFDGVCDEDDVCEGGVDAFDDDEDGVPNACDVCLDGDDTLDGDGDGVPDDCDVCLAGPDDVDSDEDRVPDACDVCEGGDDTLDGDGDGVPYDCDVCPLDLNDDSDGDGVCDSDDICADGDDAVDDDTDGVPDDCDPCPGENPNDSDGDGVCDSVDACPGQDDRIDLNGNGTPDGCDPVTELDCEDGVDDDNDLAVDCEDTDCARACATDSCAVAEPFPESGVAVGTTTGAPATLEGSCGFDGDAPEFVYTLTRDDETTVCISAANSSFDTRLYVLETCADDAVEIGCADDGVGASGRQSELEFTAAAGETYVVVLDGYDGDNGLFELTVRDERCVIPPEICEGGADEDFDLLVDCDDPDCLLDAACVDPEVCFDLVDNDLDELVDCDDPDCALEPNCLGFEDCTNGREDDGDGLTDCDDPDCALDASCVPPEVCDNGVDDNANTLVDCEDADCAEFISCLPEICDNAIDDNADGIIDCVDPACRDNAACATGGGTCAAPTDLGFGGQVGTTEGGDLINGGCSMSTGPEDVWRVQFGVPTIACLSTEGSSFDTVMYVRSDCDAGASEVACDDDSVGLTSELTLFADAGVPYATVVDGYNGAAGDYVLTMTPGACGGSGIEVCGNGYDDDGDGAVDCGDADCAGECTRPDTCADAGVLPGFAPVYGSTVGSTDDGASVTCGIGWTAPDDVYRWIAPRSGLFCISTVGSDLDTVLHAQTVCGDPATEVTCNDDNDGTLQSEIDLEAAQGTEFFLWVDGFITDEGAYTLQARQGPCSAPPTLTGTCDAPYPLLLGATEGDTSASAGEFSGTCGIDGVGGADAYVFSSPIDSSVCFEITDAAFDTRLLVQETCGGTEVVCDDDGGSGTLSRVQIEALAGEPVQVIVEGYNTGEGAYTLTTTLGPCAP